MREKQSVQAIRQGIRVDNQNVGVQCLCGSPAFYFVCGSILVLKQGRFLVYSILWEVNASGKEDIIEQVRTGR